MFQNTTRFRSGNRPSPIRLDAYLEELWDAYKRAESPTERTMIYAKIEDHMRIAYPKVR
jgi:hypothetical protein